MSIYIFSRPVRTGKTTELLNWLCQQKEACGLLMPDFGQGKEFLRYPELDSFSAMHQDENEEDKLPVGRFLFSKQKFAKANKLLIDWAKTPPETLVIDELGKIELEGKGLFSGIVELANSYRESNKRLIFIIRDTLLSQAKEKFRLSDAKVVQSLEEPWVFYES